MRTPIRSLWKAQTLGVVDAVLPRPVPFGSADRVMVPGPVNARRRIADGGFSYPAFVELAARHDPVTALRAA